MPFPTGEFPSGQRGRAVNPLALPSEVRILSPPFPRAYGARKCPQPPKAAPDQGQRLCSARHLKPLRLSADSQGDEARRRRTPRRGCHRLPRGTGVRQGRHPRRRRLHPTKRRQARLRRQERGWSSRRSGSRPPSPKRTRRRTRSASPPWTRAYPPRTARRTRGTLRGTSIRSTPVRARSASTGAPYAASGSRSSGADARKRSAAATRRCTSIPATRRSRSESTIEPGESLDASGRLAYTAKCLDLELSGKYTLNLK
jgi:hypothetical protein